MSKIVVNIFAFFLLIFPNIAISAELFSYSFEDWSGDRTTTPGYIFASSSQDYCDTHEAVTEVTNSYDGISASDGTYFMVWSINGTMSPSLSGITSSSTNPRCTAAYDGSYCNSAGYTYEIDAETSKYLYTQIDVLLPTTEWANVNNGAMWKFLRFYTIYDDPYLQFGKNGGSGNVELCLVSGSDVGSKQDYTEFSDMDDGNWHTIGFAVNYNTNEVWCWVDEPNPTTSNADMYHDYTGSAIEFDESWPIQTIEWPSNWSGTDFGSSEIWAAFDNYELHNSLPSTATQSLGSGMSGSFSFGN